MRPLSRARMTATAVGEREGGPVAVEEIHAEMVSGVWKVLVAPGEQVAVVDG